MPYRNKRDWRTYTGRCAYCGERFGGEQHTFCSASCRAKHRYYRDKPRVRECEVCGELMDITKGNRRRKRCILSSGIDPASSHYKEHHRKLDEIADAGPGDLCWELQQREEAERKAAIDKRDYPTCAYCGQEAEYAGIGRHRKYCSDKCRVYAHRARKGRKGRTTSSRERSDAKL